MTKITYHLKSGRTVESNDGKTDMQETARDVAQLLGSPGASMSAGSADSSVVIPSGSVDYVELRR